MAIDNVFNVNVESHFTLGEKELEWAVKVSPDIWQFIKQTEGLDGSNTKITHRPTQEGVSVVIEVATSSLSSAMAIEKSLTTIIESNGFVVFED